MIYLNEKYLKIPKTEGEYLYFIQIGSERLFKLGTTNDILRRMKEHERNYKQDITILWFHRVKSKWTTLKVEKFNIQKWQKNADWIYKRNDRFIIPQGVKSVDIDIKKSYHIDFDCRCYSI